MKIEVRIDPQCGEVSLTVTAPAMTDQVRRLVGRLAQAGAERSLTVFQGERAVLLSPGDILRFYGEDKGVRCQTRDGQRYAVRRRLYELEEELAGTRFVRVSHSELVNLDRVTALDLTLTGTIKMTLEDGAAVCWVSRRYVKRIKQVLGL